MSKAQDLDMGGLLILFALKDQAHADRDPDELVRLAQELANWEAEQPRDETLRALVAEAVRATLWSATALRNLLELEKNA